MLTVKILQHYNTPAVAYLNYTTRFVNKKAKSQKVEWSAILKL